ncbi:MAG: YfhO family protein [Desulfobacterales bacterium]|nr:YfhO family protein [Desulfobacterales bacterium]
MKQWKGTIHEHIPLAFIFLCISLAFIRLPLAGENLYGADFALYFRPLKEFIRVHFLSHGTIPMWNPYQFSGTPLISNIQASLFYPLGFLFYLMPSEQAYGYTIVMHCMLGCIFMYVFMRAISISPGGSFFAAIVFIFNGFFMAHLYAGHLTFVQNYIWIPLIFFFLHRFVNKRHVVHAIAAGLTLGVQILGGFPQIAFYTILGTLAFIVPLCVIEAMKRSYREVLNLGAGLALTLLIGFSLAAVQVLPTLEFTGFSTRAAGVSYFFATLDSLHPKEILAFLIPEIFGNPVDGTYWTSNALWHFWETCGYVGILPLFLIFVKEKRRELSYYRVFFVLLLLFSVLIALGKHNPLYPLIYSLPGFGSFRIPAQIIFLYVFSIAVLSGIGLDRISVGEWNFVRGFGVFVVIAGGLIFVLLAGLLFSRYHSFLFLFMNFAEGPVPHIDMGKLYQKTLLSVNKAALLVICSILLMLLQKWRKLGTRSFVVLALGVLVADLFLFCTGFIRPHDYSASTEKVKIIEQFYRNPAQGRIVTLGEVFRANDGLIGRFPSILGYDPLILRRYAHYMQASQGIELSDHLVNLEDIDLSQTKLLKSLNLRQIFLNGHVISFDNDIPYANVVYDVAIKAKEEVLPFMESTQFDARKTVVLEHGNKNMPINYKMDEYLSPVCTVMHYENERITIRASTEKAGYLVLSEMYYPGWQARVDGKEVTILRGNFLFRVIPLEAGEHEVELRFVSWPFRVGGVISIVTLVSAACLVWLLRRRRRDSLG